MVKSQRGAECAVVKAAQTARASAACRVVRTSAAQPLVRVFMRVARRNPPRSHKVCDPARAFELRAGPGMPHGARSPGTHPGGAQEVPVGLGQVLLRAGRAKSGGSAERQSRRAARGHDPQSS